MQKLVDKWKLAVTWASAKGIPLPLLRNPKHQEASITFTMLVISFVLCIAGTMDLVKSINFEHAFELFMAVSALYFGRNFQKKELSSSKEDKTTKET